MPKEILTILAVAQLLKTAEKTVYKMAQQGEPPAFIVSVDIAPQGGITAPKFEGIEKVHCRELGLAEETGVQLR